MLPSQLVTPDKPDADRGYIKDQKEAAYLEGVKRETAEVTAANEEVARGTGTVTGSQTVSEVDKMCAVEKNLPHGLVGGLLVALPRLLVDVVRGVVEEAFKE